MTNDRPILPDIAARDMLSLNQKPTLRFDECHHLPGNIRGDAARMSAAPYRLGLTATLERSDGKHVDLNWLIGPVVYSQSISEARGHTLADYDVIRIPVHLSKDEQSRYDYAKQSIEDRAQEKLRALEDAQYINFPDRK